MCVAEEGGAAGAVSLSAAPGTVRNQRQATTSRAQCVRQSWLLAVSACAVRSGVKRPSSCWCQTAQRCAERQEGREALHGGGTRCAARCADRDTRGQEVEKVQEAYNSALLQ
eukprot:2850582-Rhodomonas_salina.1